MRTVLLSAVTVFCQLAMPLSTSAQTTAINQSEPRVQPGKLSEADTQEAQRRTFAVSLIVSLGNEARSYDDLALRPRVLARAADVVWNSDPLTAQSLFRRAWEAAEKGDSEEVTTKSKDDTPSMVVTLRRLSGKDLRVEVLKLVARRDRVLAEEFLAKVKNAGEAGPSKGPSPANDGWSTSEVISKRLLAAGQLLDAGEIERAVEFALPGLNQVSASSINFLTSLRVKNPAMADQRFAMLLDRVELDPLSDANTVSGLSSYIFTPGFYITFSPDGSAVWSQPDAESPPPNLSPALRRRFFEAAASILLRPLPPTDQDFTSSGRKGKYMVLKQLLPLFDQYAPEIAGALHAQLTELAGNSAANNDRFALPASNPANAGNLLEKMQEELDHAKTSKERDEIFAAAAVRLAIKDDMRARDVADRIDDSEFRGKIRQYVDFEFVQLAIRNQDAAETMRLAKIGLITHSQRAWAYTQAARVLRDPERERALEFLSEAITEVQRIEIPRDRAILLLGVAQRFLTADRERGWQTMGEAVKAANQADNFTGDNQITYSIGSRRLIKFVQIGGEESGLAGIFRLLAKDDLNRSVDLARSFKKDAPRATATLAIAESLLDKQSTRHSNN